MALLKSCTFINSDCQIAIFTKTVYFSNYIIFLKTFWVINSTLYVYSSLYDYLIFNFCPTCMLIRTYTFIREVSVLTYFNTQRQLNDSKYSIGTFLQIRSKNANTLFANCIQHQTEARVILKIRFSTTQYYDRQTR